MAGGVGSIQQSVFCSNGVKKEFTLKARMTATKKKPGAAAHARVAVTEADEVPEIVVCLRIRGGARVSIDVAIGYHDGAHPDCFECRNRCIANGRKH